MPRAKKSKKKELLEDVVTSYNEGMTHKDIEKKYGIPRGTISYWLHEYRQNGGQLRPSKKENQNSDKNEILKKLKSGASISSLAREYRKPHSTIRYWRDQSQKIAKKLHSHPSRSTSPKAKTDEIRLEGERIRVTIAGEWSAEQVAAIAEVLFKE